MKNNYPTKKNQAIPERTGIVKYALLSFVLLVTFSQTFFSQQSYTFTNAGATGSVGPTQAQITTTYVSTNLAGSVIATGGIQSFTIPQAGNYKIEAWGAAGGTHLWLSNYPGGMGAYMSGNFTFTAGTVVKILVGQKGEDTQGIPVDAAAPGGGGGSFVYINATDPLPLIAAGGGGGGGVVNTPSIHAVTTTTGNPSTTGALGGVNGNGGQINVTGNLYFAGGGAGWLTDGTGGNTTTNYVYTPGTWGAYGGRAPVNGGAGGMRYNDLTDEGGDGGFGGGGGGGSDNMGSGGGGGFSGGAGSNWGSNLTNHTGGGAGSFNAGTNQVNTPSLNTGHGKVIITELCNITLVAAGTNSNGAICAGSSVTLTTNAVSNYSWSTGVTTSSIIVSPTITTLYSLTALSPSNCTTSSALTITVDTSSPTLTVANTANSGGICPTKTVILTASGATTYSWTGGTPTVTNGVVFSPSGTSGYSVTGYNACGSSSAATSVSIHPLPTVIAVASSASLCSGLTLTLNTTGSNASTYTWTGGYASGVGFSPVVTATYVVTGTSALSCTASAAVPVTVVTTPIIPPTSNTLINCVGNSITLTAIGATNYTWTSATQTVFTSTLAATPSTTGISTYTVTKSNSNCVDTKIISVTTNSLPTIFAIASPTLVCALNPATLAVGGGQSYTWTSPGPPSFSFTGASPVVYPPVPTTYTVAASDGTCVNRTTVFLNTNPNPTIAVVPTSSAICDGQSVTLNASGAINYTWSSTSGGTFNNTLTITDTPTTTVAYNVSGDNSFGCVTGTMQVILVNPNPTVTLGASKTLVCSGAPSTLTANGADNYTWTVNGATTRTNVVNPASLISAPVIYTVIGSYTTGCESSKTIAVNVFVPVLTVSGNTNTCAGGMVTLSGGGGNNGTYTWSTGTSTTNFQTLTTTLTAASVFTLNATTTSITTNCPATKTVAVGIYFNPTITAVAQRTTICNKESVQLYGEGGVSYTWNNSAQGGTITVNPTSQTNYTVTGTDANGCVSTGTVQVKVSGCVGINELNNSSTTLLIYPNPNNGEFTIQTGGPLSLNIINGLGQVVRTYDLTEANDHKVSIKDLANGIYFITGLSGNVQLNQKVIVSK